ncbi:(Fe-S)-binding protein [Nitrosomonas sp.]|uniref:(Fe-S)-binding protein n=1 Tax=Nitrosomonas sp. TaxID=42353 RepID=UPI00260E007E|nr:(Fe-S)-binding protein [Nitrosomonas sp.]
MSSEVSKDFIIAESNQCVSCGLCLPHCPTYRLLKSEADSPRGRIALMSGVANERIPLNKKFIQHMDRCLTCRACEAVCPNHVAYGHLIDEARVLIADQSRSSTSSQNVNIKILLRMLLLTKSARMVQLRQLLSFLQKNGLLRWLLKFNLLEKNRLFKFIAQLPRVEFPYAATTDGNRMISNTWAKVYPAKGEKRGEVALFLGCVARITDVATLNASIYVLNRLGYTVHVPSNQTCCGALHQHSGGLEQAAALAKQNKAAFAALNVSAIISTASGCGVQLLESEVADGHSRITDISKFLIEAEGWESVKIAPLPQKILVHDPCSLRNVLHDQIYPYQLIARIPGAQAVPLAGNDQCCGAAGSYFMDQPEIASMLLDDKISALVAGDAKYLVTSNIGCSMHIANGLYEKKINIEVLHPVTLLARQMGLES